MPKMGSVRRLGVFTLACLLSTAIAGSAAAWAGPIVKPVGWGPLTSKEAAKRVIRDSGFEPRPSNADENRTVPTKAQIADFRARSDMPLAGYVDGRFKGTTDEILQWAAKKWGFQPDLFRAVARNESYWDMNMLGDHGDSFGIFQVRRPYHCCLPFMRDSTAFNADYYGGILRAYFDGEQDWLNNPDVAVNNIGRYVAGDLWGSVGAWVTGNWHVPSNEQYVRDVQRWMDERPWANDEYFAEPWYKPHPE